MPDAAVKHAYIKIKKKSRNNSKNLNILGKKILTITYKKIEQLKKNNKWNLNNNWFDENKKKKMSGLINL